MKYVAPRPFADPAVATRKLLEIANATEALQDGRIHIEKINGPFLFEEGGTPRSTAPGSITPLLKAGCGNMSQGRT